MKKKTTIGFLSSKHIIDDLLRTPEDYNRLLKSPDKVDSLLSSSSEPIVFLGSQDDINKVLSSNLPIATKLAILRNHREKFNDLDNEIQTSLNDFKTTRRFINEMINTCERLKTHLFIGGCASIGGVAITSSTLDKYISFLKSHKFTTLNWAQFIELLIGVALLPLSFILVVYVIKNVPEYRQYEKSIRHYEKYLQNMKSINSGSKNPQRRLNKR